MICDRAPQVDIRNYRGGWPLLPSPRGGYIEVTSTACHFGGIRVWFVCPGCSRKCAILYPRVCRTCAGGRYESELLSPENRLIRRAFRLRERLGQRGGGLFGDFPARPKGMHWRTYSRLIEKAEAVERRILESASMRFGMPLDELI